MQNHEVVTHVEQFLRPVAPTTTPESGPFGLTKKDTSAAGAPTMTVIDGGGLKSLLANTDEVEILTLYQNDVLPYYLNQLQAVWFWASCAAMDAVSEFVFGIGSAYAAAVDDIAINAWFKIQGSASTSAIVVESDDGVTDKNDIATGLVLSSTPKLLYIDFTYGLSNVKFFMDGQRVAEGTTFDMSGASASQKVQLFHQLQKASGTGVQNTTIREIGVRYRRSFGG